MLFCMPGNQELARKLGVKHSTISDTLTLGVLKKILESDFFIEIGFPIQDALMVFDNLIG